MKRFIALIIVVGVSFLKGQVGINTPNPLANLEVRRSLLPNIADGIIPPRVSADSLQMKENLYGPAQHGALIYITKPVTRASAKMQNVVSEGYYVYDARYANADRSQGAWKKMFSDPHAFAWTFSGRPSLSAKRLETHGADVEILKISAGENVLGIENLDNDQYIVKESGLYAIDYSIAFDIEETIYVGHKPCLVIIKETNNHETQNLFAKRNFDGIKFESGKGGFAIIPSAAIHHIYHLNAGDRLVFGLWGKGMTLAGAGELTSEISIFKIR